MLYQFSQSLYSVIPSRGDGEGPCHIACGHSQLVRFVSLCEILRFTQDDTLAGKSINPCDIATDNQCVNVVCAFVRGDALKVHEMSDNGIAICDARGAKYVARDARTFQRHPHIVAFG